MAGLATGFHLRAQGFHVSIAPFCSGQDRFAPPQGIHGFPAPPHPRAPELDAIMPLLVPGFHRDTAALLTSLHGSDIWTRATSVSLEFFGTLGKPKAFHPFPVPAPFHAILGLLCFGGLSLLDRWHFVMHLERVWEGVDADAPDLEYQSADQWIACWEQSPEARRQIWDPLCRFLLNDSLATASAASLKNVLQRSFLASRQHVDLRVFSGTVRDLLIAPLKQRLASSGAEWYTGSPISSIACDLHRVRHVVLQDGGTVTADDYVLAVPPDRVLSALPERIPSKFSYFGNLEDIVAVPVTVIQCRLRQETAHPRLLLGPPFCSWTICRPEEAHDQTMVSSLAVQDSELESQPDDVLIQRVLAVLRTHPACSNATHPHGLVEEAIFRGAGLSYSSRPGLSVLRPIQQSPLANLFLAGGWTATELPPSSIESDLVSARLCAAAIQEACSHVR